MLNSVQIGSSCLNLLTCFKTSHCSSHHDCTYFNTQSFHHAHAVCYRPHNQLRPRCLGLQSSSQRTIVDGPSVQQHSHQKHPGAPFSLVVCSVLLCTLTSERCVYGASQRLQKTGPMAKTRPSVCVMSQLLVSDTTHVHKYTKHIFRGNSS